MPFPPDLLTEDEELILDLRPHWWFLVPTGTIITVAVLLGLGALVNDWYQWIEVIIGIGVLAALVGFVLRYLLWTTTNFVVTSERVISRAGVISKKGVEIPLDRINTVFFNQTLFERMIGAGDLGIESAGEGGRQSFTDIRKPNLVQNEIYRQVEALEERKFHRMGQAAAGAHAAVAPQPAPASPSVPEQLEKLHQLLVQGALTQDEYEAKKRDLLDRM